jgi:hypothetical protein
MGLGAVAAAIQQAGLGVQTVARIGRRETRLLPPAGMS